MTSSKLSTVYISLGSNINPEANLKRAVELMGQRCKVLAVSHAYRTPPQGFTEQADFLNMAVKVETDLDAATLKHNVLDWIERELKRVRDPNNKNAPRTIDLDISLWNDDVFDYGEKPWHVPDRDIARFAHVALPLAEIAPEYVHPVEKVPLSLMAARLSGETFERKRLFELTSAFILLGSNYEQNSNLVKACYLLETQYHILHFSPAYWFLAHPEHVSELDNWMFAVIEVEIQVSPQEFQTQVLNGIQEKIDGQYDGEKLASCSPITFEILLWGNQIADANIGLAPIPSPNILQSAYIASLLAEIEPETFHPIEKVPFKQIAASFDLNQKRFYKQQHWYDE